MIFKKEKNIIILAVLAIIIIASFWFFNRPKITYYYGKNCPHCQNVGKYIEENKIAEKVKFSKKEVSNPAVSIEFLKRSKSCGIEEKDAGIPLVYSEGKCYVGDVDAIAFFKEKAGL
jgi:hypothetical protein